LGFGVVAIIGGSLDKAQVGDIVVGVMHSEFCTRAQVWVKMQDGTRGWVSRVTFQRQYHFTSYLA
jgi:hypothetical protein